MPEDTLVPKENEKLNDKDGSNTDGNNSGKARGRRHKLISSKESIQKLLVVIKRSLIFSYKISPKHFIIVFLSGLVLSFLAILNDKVRAGLFDELIALVENSSSVSTEIIKIVVIVLLLMAGMDLLNRIRRLSRQILLENTNVELSRISGEASVSVDMAHYDNPETNNLINRALSRSGSLTPFVRYLIQTSTDVFDIILSSIALFSLSPVIIAITIVTNIPEAMATIVYFRKTYELRRENEELIRDSNMTEGNTKRPRSIMEIRIFNTSSYLVRRFNSLDRIMTAKNLAIFGKFSRNAYLLGLIQTLGYGFIFVYLIQSTIAGTISVGLLTFYVAMTNRLGNSIYSFLTTLTQIYEQGLYVSDFFAFLDLEKKVISGSKKLELVGRPPVIEFKDVSFKYPLSDQYVLKNFSLNINPGDKLAVVGENGAGKTTLIKLLMRFYDVNEGAILLDGTDIREYDLADWYTKVGALFQEFNFYHFSAKENIGVGDVRYIEDMTKIMESAKQAGAHEFIEKYEKGYDQILSKQFSGGIDPSQGQRQRIALARAFFKDAELLILDEPTSSIDPKAEFAIFEKLFEFAQNKTVIIISHRFSTVRNADRIIVLDDGKIIEDGSHEDLMKIHEGKYKHAFELQKRGYE